MMSVHHLQSRYRKLLVVVARVLLLEGLQIKRAAQLDPGQQIPVRDLMDVRELQLMAGSGINGHSTQVLLKELVLEESSVFK